MITKLITLILATAALCIGAALMLLGNVYSGGAVVTFVIIAAGLSQCSRFNELALSSLRGFILVPTGVATGAALILLAVAVLGGEQFALFHHRALLHTHRGNLATALEGKLDLADINIAI